MNSCVASSGDYILQGRIIDNGLVDEIDFLNPPNFKEITTYIEQCVFHYLDKHHHLDLGLPWMLRRNPNGRFTMNMSELARQKPNVINACYYYIDYRLRKYFYEVFPIK
jgi:hypothetical protein